MSEIKIDISGVTTAINQLEGTLYYLESYSGSFIRNVRDVMARQQSDFTKRMDDLLNSMADTKALCLVENVRQFLTDVQTYRDTFVQEDRGMAEDMGRQTNGQI